MQPSSSQAAIPAELMQKHNHGVSAAAQDLGSPRLPLDNRSVQRADVALSAHLLTAPSAASWPSTAHSTDFSALSDLDACWNGMRVMPPSSPCCIVRCAMWYESYNHCTKSCSQYAETHDQVQRSDIVW